MTAGGGWLVAVGGNWYYLLAGIGCVISAVLIFAKRTSAVYWFALVFIGTLIWTIQESGLDYWRWVPRFDVMLLLGIVFAFQLPSLSPGISRKVSGFAALCTLSSNHPGKRQRSEACLAVPYRRFAKSALGRREYPD